jgi:hypothetical protein
MSRALRISIRIALTHMVLGNVVGWLICQSHVVSDILWYAFMPHTLVWALSCLVGWDGMSLLLMAFGFGIVVLFCYPIGHYIDNPKQPPKP